jgi:hypothetical protein
VRNGPAHELAPHELISFWSRLPREAREILSSVIVDEVVQPKRSRTLSEAVAACELRRRRQLKEMQGRLRELEIWQAHQRNGGIPATGRPKSQRNRYSGQQLQALSRAWARFAASRPGDREDDPARIDAFVRSLAPHQRAWLPKAVKADTVRKLIQQGSGLRRAAKTWRARPDVRDALYRLMQIETDRLEINRIVRELASLQPGTEIAERRLTAFVSETISLHRARRAILGIEESFIKL